MKDALSSLVVLKALIPVLTSNQGYPSKCLTTLKAQAVPIKMVTGMVLEKGPGAPVGPGVILLIAGFSKVQSPATTEVKTTTNPILP